jgi:uncharacterized protein (DUF952 family)
MCYIGGMRTIVVASTNQLWADAKKNGTYTQSIVGTSGVDEKYIHANTLEQIIPMLNRHYTDYDDILILLVDLDKVSSEVKFEASSGPTPGLFPHIYGPLNIDAVYETLVPTKDASGNFMESEILLTLHP